MCSARAAVADKRKTSDRRHTKTDYKRRIFDRRTRTFLYERTIHLTDTNMFGSVYFARFFDMQGEAREEYMLFLLGKDMAEFIGAGYNIVTISASNRYYAPLMVYDRIVVELQVVDRKRTKAKMQFTIKRQADNFVCAVGEQWIGFTTREGRPIAIPDVVLKNFQKISPT